MDMKVLIVDDEATTGLYLQTIIEQVPGVKVAAVCASGREALAMAATHHPQVVFLDVDMPEMNGLELALALTEKYEDIYFVFATAYPDYALQAFELYAYDYILKPFHEERIKKTLRKLQYIIQKPSSPKSDSEMTIWVENGKERICLCPSDIVYIESNNHRTVIKTADHSYLTWHNINQLKNRLEPCGFYQCHRSYLVNLKHVKEIIQTGRTFQVALQSGEKIPLSRQQERDFSKKIVGRK